MISKSQRFLLEAIKASLFNTEFKYPPNIDWNDVLIEAKSQTVNGLINPVLPFRDESYEQVKAIYMRILYEQDKVLKCFSNAEIPCVILKGSAASIYYPKPYLRTMGDIDILVPNDRLKDSIEILESNGYIYEHGKGQGFQISDVTREITYSKNGVLFEIHRSFSSLGFNVDDILESAINRRVYCELNGYRIPILPTPENGLVLLGHINQHLQNNVLGLRQIIDWEMYVYSVTDKELWRNQFLPLVEDKSLMVLGAYITRMCTRYLGLPVDNRFDVEVDDSLVEELMEVILTDGNFGRRAYADFSDDELKMISASYGIKHFGLFGYFTQVGMGSSQFFEKHPYLRVFAFIYGFFMQLVRGVRSLFFGNNVGKKMIDGKQLYKKQSKRYELYKKLGVRMGKE